MNRRVRRAAQSLPRQNPNHKQSAHRAPHHAAGRFGSVYPSAQHVQQWKQHDVGAQWKASFANAGFGRELWRIHDDVHHKELPAARAGAHSKELVRVFARKCEPNDEDERVELPKPQEADNRRGIVHELLEIGASRPPQTARIDYRHAQQEEAVKELLACEHL